MRLVSPPLLPFGTVFPQAPFPAAPFKILECAGQESLLGSFCLSCQIRLFLSS